MKSSVPPNFAMPPEDRIRLRQMPEAIEDAGTFIVGMCNRLVRAGFDIDTGIVWKTVTDELPALAVQLRPFLQDRQ